MWWRNLNRPTKKTQKSKQNPDLSALSKYLRMTVVTHLVESRSDFRWLVTTESQYIPNNTTPQKNPQKTAANLRTPGNK